MTHTTNKRLVLLVLRWSCCLLFFGRAWQHIFWDAPYRTFFWDETLMEGVVTSLLDISWHDYVTNPLVDANIQRLIKGTGIFYLAIAFLSLGLQKRHRFGQPLLYLAALSMSFLALLYCKEKFYHIGQFFEYSCQIISPVLLALVLYHGAFWESKNFKLIAKIAVAFTFTAHGVYALGYYPRPVVFLDMTINILGVSESYAQWFLTIAGVLDFIAAIGLFLPKHTFIFILYCVVWGFLTALARTWANVRIGPLFFELVHQYLPQTIYRMPHTLIPLLVLILDYPNLQLFNRLRGKPSREVV